MVNNEQNCTHTQHILSDRVYWSVADITRATGQTDAAVRGTLKRAKVKPITHFGRTRVFSREAAEMVARILDMRRRADTLATELGQSAGTQ